MKITRVGTLLVAAALVACGAGNSAPGAATARPSSAADPPTPATPTALSMPSVAALTALGEQMVVRHPTYGYYVSCVNFKANGVWAPPPAPVDYSSCPITDQLRDRMQATRADFLDLQNPAQGRTVEVTPRPGGGIVVITLAYAPVVKLELVAVRSGDRLLIGDVVEEGDVTGPDPPPISFDEKPTPPAAPPTVTPGRDTRILDVPWDRQEFGLSCEEASLRMALAYEHVATSDAAILDIIGTDERPAYMQDGVLRWGNPYTTFVGNPNGSEVALTGYGTYYSTIAHAAVALGGRVLRSGEGVAPAQLYDSILTGHPAVVWSTYRWISAPRNDYVSFDGRRIPYAGPVEHAVTAVGVSPTAILINDPLLGVAWIDKATFEASYATYNQMAVILE